MTEFDLYGLLIDGDKSKDVKLDNGDVIFIPPVGPQAAVLGSVKRPAIYEALPGEQLGALIASAGGVSAIASQARVSIERIEDHRDRQAMEVAYDTAGLATPIADGDLVRVFSIIPRYQKTVTLRGNTANPGHFAWHPGMHISDLIPDKDSLITRNYWWRRARLGLPAPEELDVPTPPVVQWNSTHYPFVNSYPLPSQTLSSEQTQSQSSNQTSNQNQTLYQNQRTNPDPNLVLFANPEQGSAQEQAGNQDLYFPGQDQNNPPQSGASGQSTDQSQPSGANPGALRAGGSSLGAAETRRSRPSIRAPCIRPRLRNSLLRLTGITR